MHKVFVFGTLKEGFPNYKTNKGLRYPGEFKTQYRYPFYLVGERHSPWLILNKGHGYQVSGQVFMVDDAALAEMDSLERIHEVDGYRRIEINVIEQNTGEEVNVYAYGKPLDQLYGADIQCEVAGEYTLSHAHLYRSRMAVAS
ncbi:gamma-glutamylcyclotransferase family protein [Vibrio nitrifigilis]|uniref:Gamma-glutamylcyclotransferase family protein n=1 Tax=Vibrio nitrifigilis TaxID=2789781 RepID=A0ABS0GD87_9VIBR|nr:gamma-glutamylcyclotransferase family protein [Vibrio nitrifigilis]MBF9000351.1 gamma-glutamylcyclotransferase [Vibrio nitrifigilis]